jgi:hypothetical protein
MLGFFGVCIAGAGHRVITAFMPGMTSAETPESQSQAFAGAVVIESFYGVVRAGGLEATVVAQPGTQQILITPDRCDQ